MCLSEQFEIRFLKYFWFLVVPMILIFLEISGCANSTKQENHLACQLKLEADRQKAREGGYYSYKSLSFEECRSPVLYRIIED